MRNHFARVVLGASLVVASAIAQAPASSIRYFQQVTPFEEANAVQSGSSLGADAARFDSDRVPLTLPTMESRLLQDDQDYTVATLFREAHGEFMDRRERYNPAVELRARWMPNQNIKREPGEFDLFGYDVDAEFPVVIYPDSYLLFGVYQYGRHYATSNGFGTQGNGPIAQGGSGTGGWGDETLTAAGVRVGLGVFLDDNVLFEAVTNPGIYSDLEGTLTHKDYDFPSSAMFTVQANNDFFFKFGARYNQIYEDAPWLPWLGFSWELAEGVRLDLLLPETVEFSWWPTGSTSFSVGALVQGAQYRVRSSAATGKERINVNVQEVLAYVGMTHRITDNWSFSGRVGSILAGHYDLSDGQNAFVRASGSLDQGFYADISFGIDW